MNRFEQLYQSRLSEATRPFNARGSALKRCKVCRLAEATCICLWCRMSSSRIDIVLLMHRDEVLKPTNTGRLIADVLPKQTYAFVWHRTEPDNALLALLADPTRACAIVFPADNERLQQRPTLSVDEVRDASQKITLLVLDGTWKQARKMLLSSQWLATLPLLVGLPDTKPSNYAMRSAVKAGQLSTAEAVAHTLSALSDDTASQDLLDYFSVFNEHYRATRLNIRPTLGEAHTRLTR